MRSNRGGLFSLVVLGASLASQADGTLSEVDRARYEAVQAFVKNAAAAPTPTGSASPRRGSSKVLAASEQISDGVILRSAHFSAVEIPAEQVTDSFVPAQALEKVEGALSAIPLRKGDLLTWQMLDGAVHPRHIMLCMRFVRQAVRKARGETPPPAAQDRPAAQLRGKEIVVATKDIAAGEPLTFDVVTHLPDRSYLTESAIRAESVTYVIGQRPYMPILKGDVLMWTYFEVPNDKPTVKACEAAFPAKGSAAEQLAAIREAVKRGDHNESRLGPAVDSH